MTRTNTPWRPSEYERARQLRESGLTWREVGAEMGRSEGAMHCLLATLKASDWSALAEAILGNLDKARAYLDVSRALTRYNQRGEA